MILAIWSYRGFIAGNVKREFQSKYSNSLLGAAWTVINPLAMIVVYTVIFSQIMRARLAGVDGAFAYSIYLCSGVLTWGLFAEIVSRAQNVFLENANILKKLSFPRLCLPVIVVANALLNFSIIFGLFTLFLLITETFAYVFIILQVEEYLELTFTISDNVYCSLFFLLTGFHGMHVLVGTIFILVTHERVYLSHFSNKKMIGFGLALVY